MGLTLILSICDKCYGSVIKSTLLCQRHTTCHDHYRALSVATLDESGKPSAIPQKQKQKKTFISVYSWLNSVRSLFFRFLQCLREQDAPRQNLNAFGFCSRFSLFLLAEKESLKGITVFGVRLSGCLHTSRITTNTVNALTRASFSARVFEGFCL